MFDREFFINNDELGCKERKKVMTMNFLVD
jgi:hypothetical protein